MKPQWEYEVLRAISVTMLTLAVICLMCGCHTRKVAQEHSTEVATETAVGHCTDKTDMTAFWTTFGRYVTSTDSVAMELSADSIVTPSGAVIYAPDIRRIDYGQKSDAETDASMSASIRTDTTIENTETSDKTTEVVSAQQAETTAIAEPPNITAILITAIVGVVLLAAAVLLWLIYRKK